MRILTDPGVTLGDAKFWTMGSLWHTAPVSLLLHGVAYLMLAAGLPHPVEKKPLVLDLAMTEPSSPSTTVRKARQPDRPALGQPKRIESRTSATNKLPAPQALPATPAVPVAPHAAPVQPVQPAPTEHRVDVQTTAPPAIFTTQAAGTGTDPPPAGTVGGRSTGAIGHMSGGEGVSPGPSSGSLKKRYLSEHFAYIRDQILKNLVYPQAARRIGWSGKVVVSFVVTSDGGVDKVKVLTGSGYQVFDINAVETVRKAAPFPRPPLSVELVLPIKYNLE